MKLRYLVSLAVVGSTLAFAACGGGDDDDSAGNGDAGRPTAATSEATKPAEQATPTRAPTQPAATSTAESASSILDRLASNLQKATYNANYDVEISSQGQTLNGTAVFASKPPKSVVKMALSLGASAGEINLTIIEDGTASYFCTNFGLGGQCSRDQSLLGPVGDVQKAIDDARAGAAKEIEKRTISGRTARCFETTTATGAKSTMCFDEKDSVMLYMESTGFKMTAKDVTSSVDDKLFELPYPVS